MELRTALLTGDLDEDDRGEVEKCVVETGEALDRLREIAHGAYPSLLASSGLEPALRSLARRRGAHLRVTQQPPRLPHSVEGLAYTVVADLLENGHGSDVGEVSLRVESGLLIVDIDGPETEPASLLRERVGALDGTLERRTDTNRWRLIVPCE
jgi:signal transduction histidine kinase